MSTIQDEQPTERNRLATTFPSRTRPVDPKGPSASFRGQLRNRIDLRSLRRQFARSLAAKTLKRRSMFRSFPGRPWGLANRAVAGARWVARRR